jgi:hypothetical protein
MLANLKGRQFPHHYSGLSTDLKPTTGVPYGSTLYETDTGLWYIFTIAGWKAESLPVITATLALPALIAGEAHIGEIGRWADLIVVTPTIGAAAFAADDVVGGKLTITNAVRINAGKGKITGLKVVDAAKQNAGLLVFIFGADLAGIYADNSAEAVTAADWLKWIGTIEILGSDWREMANASLVDLGFDMAVESASGRNLFALIITPSGATFTANCLQLTFGMEE